MDRIILTEKDIKNAVSYAPVTGKTGFIDHCATNCINAIYVNLGDEENTPLPNMYVEDTLKKQKYLMAAFIVLYLGVPMRELNTVEGDIWLLTDDEYDRWACSHVLNQLERFKSSADLRDKVFDMLKDYRSLEKALSTSIYGMLQVQNDPINRLFMKIQSDLSAQNLEEQKAELEKLAKEFEDLKNKRTEAKE